MTREPSTPPSETLRRDEGSGLSSSRSEFAASLSRRLESILGALAAMSQQPSSSGRRDNFLRRVHALGASAKVLGFAAAGELLTRAEHQIRTSHPESLADDILAVQKQLEELPPLVLRGPYSLLPPSQGGAASRAPAGPSEPLSIVVWGSDNLLDSLKSLDRASTILEITVVTSPEKLRGACVTLGPDILLLDAQQGSITLLVDELAQAPELGDAALIVVNVPDEASQGLLELGVRIVLPTQFTVQQLSRALLQIRHPPAERSPSPAPLGNVTLKDLAEHLAQEIRQGLVDCTTPNAHLERIALGDGTQIRAALWSALAQIRDQVIEATDGRVKFSAGPEGAELLAPKAHSRSLHRDQSIEQVDLTGRRILVVDDDAAVAWFVGGTLRAAGAVVTEAHDGAEALNLAYRAWPELIVSDVVMPEMDGFALCHALKRDVLLRDVPIVLLSWKEDLLFRIRDLGADADAYLRKEASGSTVVRRVKELLFPRVALERRLASDGETRGRLDGTTMRLLLELTADLSRPVRIAVRDAEALYDLRVRHGSLVALSRTLHGGAVEHGNTVLGPMLGIAAGRFSVTPDREFCEPMFSGSLAEVLRPSALRARAAQRVLSGLNLGMIEQLAIESDAFGSDLPLLPVSLRPIADELLRGTAPRQLLASGVASVQLLESLLSDVARRGAVKRIVDVSGADLLAREMQLLEGAPSLPPPKPTPPALFSFQLTPSPAPTSPTPTAALIGTSEPSSSAARVQSEQPSRIAVRDNDSRPIANEPELTHDAKNNKTPAPIAPALGSPQPSLLPKASSIVPTSKPPTNDDVDWALELTWDSTPPPPQSHASVVATDIPASRPITSGGFMRPSIATLDRGALQETPDLANAVVKAMSEVTPPPSPAIPTASKTAVEAAPTTQTDATRPADAMHNAAAATKPEASAAFEPPAEVRTDTPAQLTQALQPSALEPLHEAHLDASVGTTNGEQHAHEPPASRTVLQQDAPVALHDVGSSHSQSLAEAPLTQLAPLQAAVPTLHPGEPTVDSHFAPVAPVQAAAAAHLLSGETTPNALPVVQKPPRPSGPRFDPSETKEPGEREPEDPVFPLVSAPASQVDIQPSIELGPSGSVNTPAAAIADAPGAHPGPDRDTLRSPSEKDSESSASIRSATPDFPVEARQSSERPVSNSSPAVASVPVESLPSDPHSASSRRAASARPNTARVSDQPPTAHPVGWIQALGLAALAGIVTFAATVPLASWIRNRQHPVRSEPPIVQADSSAPSQTSSLGQSTLNTDASSAPAASDQPGASEHPAAATSSVAVQEGPAPPDITLAPGQALIEVSTGAGHAIFVDDAFVGRGPVRVITVGAGRHNLRTRLNGAERSDNVDVSAGRLLRVSLEQAWK